MRDISRLFAARSIAVIGGGAWCASIIEAAGRIGFEGEIFVVHPSGKVIAGVPSRKSVAECDGPIDAAFVGVNRRATIEVVGELSAIGAGGAICFASGFLEAVKEDESGADLQAELLAASGEMPLLGPNCYGFINALDRVAVWPDQHGMKPVERGVAILTQSSNIAINLTMQQRALPIAMMVTCGNMAQTSQAEIAETLLDDPRITAIGLHIEGFADTRHWHRVALKAAERGVPMIAIKVGASHQAQQATISHTASMAGSEVGADALLRHLGIGRTRDIPTFLETLKLLHVYGPLQHPTLSSISCSGGEASLAADTAEATELSFPPLKDDQKQALNEALGPMVALANPLDYHTYVWRDAEAMAKAWTPMAAEGIGLTMTIVDYPTTDAQDWICATDAALKMRADTQNPVAVVATLPELMPVDIAEHLIAGGVVPMCGLSDAIHAAEIAACLPQASSDVPLPGGGVMADITLSEAQAKFALSAFDLDLPRRVEAQLDDITEAAQGLMAPLALKGLGLAHKSEAGAIALGLDAAQLEDAAQQMPADEFLVEEMVTDGVAELLVGVTRDPAHGLLLTLGAGGVLTEVWQDCVTLLLPASDAQVSEALDQLKIAKLLNGFRGKPAASRPAIIAAVHAVQQYVIENHAVLGEVEINPLICTPTRAVAVDALIRRSK